MYLKNAELALVGPQLNGRFDNRYIHDFLTPLLAAGFVYVLLPLCRNHLCDLVDSFVTHATLFLTCVACRRRFLEDEIKWADGHPALLKQVLYRNDRVRVHRIGLFSDDNF